jgi:hypothetical protein
MEERIERKLMKEKDFNQQIQDQFKNLELPTEEEIKHDTHRLKNSIAHKLYHMTPRGKAQVEKTMKILNSPKNIAKKTQLMREQRGYPFKIIFPDGKEKHFKGHFEAKEYFGGEWNSMILPTLGAKRIERKKFKNCIVHRTDIIVDKAYLEKLKEIVRLKVNPPKKKRDYKAWAEKMKIFRTHNKKYHDMLVKSARSMGKKNSRKVQTPRGMFDSQKLTAEAYGVHHCTIRDWMRKKPKEFYFVK